MPPDHLGATAPPSGAVERPQAADRAVRGPIADAERLLVVRLDNLGDVVLTGPFVRAVREVAARARITLLASPGAAAAAPLLPWYDEVVPMRAVWQDADGRVPFDPGREAALVDLLRAGRYDAALILTSFSQTPWCAAYAAYLAGIPMRAALAADFGGSVLSHAVTPPPNGTHQAERNLHLAEGIGVPVHERQLTVRIPTEAHARADEILDDLGIEPGEAIAIVPGASCAARRWDAVRYGAVARGFAAAGRRIIVLGTDREVGPAAAIAASAASAVSLAGATEFPVLAALIERSSLVVCGNSAALHLADALDRPIVALYSGTDLESEWGPRTARSALFRVPTACAPCRRFDCPFNLACLDVEPAAVVRAGLGLLVDAPAPGEERWIASAS